MDITEEQMWIRVLSKDYHIIPKIKKAMVSDKELLDIVSETVANAHGTNIEALKSKSRKFQFPDIRYKVFYIALKIRPEMSLSIAGVYFSRAFKNPHCIALYGRNRVKSRMDVMPVYKSEIERMQELCLLGLINAKNNKLKNENTQERD